MSRLLPVLVLTSACTTTSNGQLGVVPFTTPETPAMTEPRQPPDFSIEEHGTSKPNHCVGAPFGSIQVAIDDSVPGEVLMVCPGVHRERLVLSGKQLTLQSRDGAAVTVIDAEGLGRPLWVEAGSDVVVAGLTFRNGLDESSIGGNVGCDDSTLVLRGNVLEAGNASRGGGYGTRDCTGLVEGNAFVGNHASEKGGGLYVRAGVDVVGNTFDGNRAAEGGGAYVKLSTSDIAQNTFVDNFSIDDGGGLFAYDGAPTIDANTFERNVSEEEGGGLRVKIAEARITNNVLAFNHADWRGGAAKISHDEVYMAGNTVTDNTSDQWAGGVLLFEAASLLRNETYLRNEAEKGGAIVILEGWGSVDIEDSVFRDNLADDDGGHLYIELPSYSVRLRRVELTGGEAEWGGAILAEESGLLLENTLLADNVATDGGGALCLDEVSGNITNSLLLDNDAPEGSAMRIDTGTWDLRMTNSVLAGNRGGAAVQLAWGWGPTIHYSGFYDNDANFQGMWSVVGRNGNTDADPRFVDPAAGNYRLSAGSALIDAGDPDLHDPDGTRSDIGLFGGPNSAP